MPYEQKYTQHTLKRCTTLYNMTPRKHSHYVSSNKLRRSKSMQIVTPPSGCKNINQRCPPFSEIQHNANGQSKEYCNCNENIDRKERVSLNVKCNNERHEEHIPHRDTNRSSPHKDLHHCEHQMCKIERLKTEYRTKTETQSQSLNTTFTIKHLADFTNMTIEESFVAHQICYQNNIRTSKLSSHAATYRQAKDYTTHSTTHTKDSNILLEKYFNGLNYNTTPCDEERYHSVYCEIGDVEIDAIGPIVHASYPTQRRGGNTCGVGIDAHYGEVYDNATLVI